MDNSNSMKSVCLTGIRELNVFNTTKPELKNDDDVLIRIKSVGICGSDIHYYNEGNIGSQVVQYPWTIGHEATGQIVEVGKNVSNLKPGDRVAIEPTIYCGICEQCLQNRKHTCLNQKFLGCPDQIEGCMSEYFIMPAYCCFKFPESLSYELAVFAEPLSIGVYATKLYGGKLKGKKIGIFGVGPIGLSVLASCIKAGANGIYVTDVLDYRNQVALNAGAIWAGNPDKYSIVDEVSELEPQLLDVVFECCGKQEAVDQALQLLKPGGSLMMVGIPEVDRISTKMDLMRRKEIRFQNVRRQNNSFEDAIEMIARDPEYFESFITHHFKMEHAGNGFELVRQYQENVIKAVVEP